MSIVTVLRYIVSVVLAMAAVWAAWTAAHPTSPLMFGAAVLLGVAAYALIHSDFGE